MTSTSELPLLRVEGLECGYHGRALLPPIDLRIERGQTWALVGRNGSGKSTFAKTILGLLKPVAGSVTRDAKLTYVPQRRDEDTDVPARVVDFVRAGIDRGLSFLDPFFVLKHMDRVVGAMRDTSVIELAKKSYAELSEGQKQRVLIARALASDPSLIVLDEPTSAMDPINEGGIFELLEHLRDSHQLGLVVASHQMSFVPDFATHVLIVDGDQKVAMAGPKSAVTESDVYRSRYGTIRRG